MEQSKSVSNRKQEGVMDSQANSTVANNNSSGIVLSRKLGLASEGTDSAQSASCSVLTSGTLELSEVSGPAPASSRGPESQPDRLMLCTRQLAAAQSQTDIVEREDKATDPLLLWGPDGWKCQRCHKPPLAPGRETGVDSLKSIDPFVFQGTKKRRTSSGSSSSPATSSSLHSASNDAAPQMSTFKLTPHKTQMCNLKDILRTWNCARGDQKSCCPFHNAVKHMQEIHKRMLRQQCHPLWSPYSGGQCCHCYSMVDFKPDPDDPCDSCGLPFGEEDVWQDVNPPSAPWCLNDLRPSAGPQDLETNNKVSL